MFGIFVDVILAIRDRSDMRIYATNLFIYFWIKMYLNLSNFLTIQKLARHFVVTVFAGTLKPNIFGAPIKRDGVNA